MLNKAIIIGNVGRDAEVGVSSKSGRRWAKFSVATNKRWRDKDTGEKMERASWHRVVVWGDELAALCQSRLKTGTKVYVEGEMETRKFNGNDGVERSVTEIVVQGFGGKIVFLESAESSYGVPDPE